MTDTTERFIRATEPIQVELNGTIHAVKPLSFKDYIIVQRALRKSFDEGLTTEAREDAYITAIELLAERLKLPVNDVMEQDSEFVNKLIEVFLLMNK
jgi:hypothetical protein